MTAMNLTVEPTDSHPYTSSAESILFRYCVSFEAPCVVYGSMDVTGYLLVNVDDELVMVGGGSNILRSPGTPVDVGPDSPLVAIVEVLSDPDDQGVIVPGTYQLHASAVVYASPPGGGAKPNELRATCTIEII